VCRIGGRGPVDEEDPLNLPGLHYLGVLLPIEGADQQLSLAVLLRVYDVLLEALEIRLCGGSVRPGHRDADRRTDAVVVDLNREHVNSPPSGLRYSEEKPRRRLT